MNLISDLLETFPASKRALVAIDRDGERREWHFGELSNGLRTAAGKVNARFLDLSRAGEGHEACAAKPESEWFTRLTVGWDGLKNEKRSSHALQESFHPNALGHQQFGRCLTEFLATDKRDGACVPRLDGSLGLSTES